MKQLGISPKVVVPAVAQLAAGIVLLVAGERELGVGLVVASASTAVLGYTASPGDVVHPPEPDLPTA